MRLLTLVASLALLFPASSRAGCLAGDCLDPDRPCEACLVDPRASLELAQLDRRYYRRVEYPSRMRALRTEIEFTESRIDALRNLLVDYGRVTRFRTGNALTVTSNNAHLTLLAEEAHLRDLRERKAFEQRYHRQMKRLHAERVRQAAWAAAPLGEPSIEITNH